MVGSNDKDDREEARARAASPLQSQAMLSSISPRFARMASFLLGIGFLFWGVSEHYCDMQRAAAVAMKRDTKIQRMARWIVGIWENGKLPQAGDQLSANRVLRCESFLENLSPEALRSLTLWRDSETGKYQVVFLASSEFFTNGNVQGGRPQMGKVPSLHALALIERGRVGDLSPVATPAPGQKILLAAEATLLFHGAFSQLHGRVYGPGRGPRVR